MIREKTHSETPVNDQIHQFLSFTIKSPFNHLFSSYCSSISQDRVDSALQDKNNFKFLKEVDRRLINRPKIPRR